MGRLREISKKARISPLIMGGMLRRQLRLQGSEAVAMNIDQLFSGHLSTGELLPNYSNRSVILGKPAGPIKLFDTGDFYRGFFVEKAEWPFIISSKDSKTKKLTVRYGFEIFGLTNENLTEFIRAYVLPEYVKQVRKAILLR